MLFFKYRTTNITYIGSGTTAEEHDTREHPGLGGANSSNSGRLLLHSAEIQKSQRNCIGEKSFFACLKKET